MRVTCPRCGREIPATDVVIEYGLARCRACNIVSRCAGPPTPGYVKPQVSMPPRFSIAQDGIDFLLIRRWFSPLAFFLLFFCVFWDGFFVFWYAMALHSRAPLLFKLFPVIHVGVGAALTYTAAAMFVNRTVIRLGTQSLSVRHGPLPWPGNKELPRSDVEQLFCEEMTKRGRNGVSYIYKVSVILRDGSCVPLVSGLGAPEQALFIEEKVESLMGIKDRPVPGEMATPVETLNDPGGLTH